MATHPRDGTTQGPVVEPRLIPLRVVAFNQPTSIPGATVMMLTVEAKAQRLVDGHQFICPQPFLNREANTVVIEEREYPMSRVHFYERAKMALSKNPELENLDAYTIGKRPPVRVLVTPSGAIKPAPTGTVKLDPR